MKYLPSNTLAHFNAAPQTHQHDLSQMPVAVFSVSTANFKSSCGHVSPMDEAVTFYTLNHAASLIRQAFTDNETLPLWAETIMRNYTDVCVSQGERMLHYLLLVTTREMRHLKSQTSAKVWTDLKNKYGVKAAELIRSISNHGDESAAMNHFLNHTGDMELLIGNYTKALQYAYYHGSWSSSYGGPKWGSIADALVAVIDGTTSMEMLVDTGYTLAHNTAPVFNKGMMYSGPNATVLATTLDVQRAGCMLDLMAASETLGVTKTPLAVETVALLKLNYSENERHEPTFKGYVDWKLVDSLRPTQEKTGNPTKYAKVIAAQKPPKAEKPVLPGVPVLLTLGGKPVKVVGQYQVSPQQSVTLVERVGS